ncbi:hypothetical protein GCM10028815_02040 [Mariniluteicoccus flavus]
MGLDVRLKMARLYLTTDTRGSLDAFAEFVEAVFSGGVDVVQLRQPGLSVDDEVEALDLARTISYHYQGLVVVSDRPEVAKQFAADVLHLGGDMEGRTARASLHQWGLIGRAAQDESLVKTALADPEVNFVTVGPVFGPGSAGLGLVEATAALQAPSEPASKPWFAAGGIDRANLDDVIAAGARRAVVGRAITAAKDPQAAARELSDRLRQSWDDDKAMDAYAWSIVKSGNASFQTNPDGSITPDGTTNAPAAMPTGEQDAVDPTPGFGSSRHESRGDRNNDRGYGRDR